jgi:hypothetical protein
VTNVNEGNKLSWNSVPEDVLERALIPLNAEVHYSNDGHYKLIKACLNFMHFYSKKAKPDGPLVLHKKVTKHPFKKYMDALLNFIIMTILPLIRIF